MAIGLVACKADKNDDPTQIPTAQVNDSTMPTNSEEPSGDHEHGDEEHLLTADDKQAMWENVLSEGKLAINSDCTEVVLTDVLKMQILSDSDEQYVSVESIDGLAGAALYRQGDKVYFKEFGEDENGVLGCMWYECVFTENSEGSVDITILDDAEKSIVDTEYFIDMLNDVISLQYIETVDGYDHLVLKCNYVGEEIEMESDEWTRTFDALLEVEYNGVVGQFRRTEAVDANGEIAWSSRWETEEKPLESMYDWEFDVETLTLTNGDEVLQCKLIKDNIADGTMTSTESGAFYIHVLANPNTFELKTMSISMNGETCSIEFVDCHDVSELIDMPEGVEEIIQAEDAAMGFAMMMFMMIMNSAQ